MTYNCSRCSVNLALCASPDMETDERALDILCWQRRGARWTCGECYRSAVLGGVQWQEAELVRAGDGARYIVRVLQRAGAPVGCLVTTVANNWLDVQVYEGSQWLVIESRDWGNALSIRMAQQMLEEALIARQEGRAA